jgi:hypothetical protein
MGLVLLFMGDYALAIVMLTKKDIFYNWTKHHMCGDYHLVNIQIHLDNYAMPLLEEIFNTLKHAKAFNTLES